MKNATLSLLLFTLCTGAGIPVAGAQAAMSKRCPITTEAVARALHNDGFEVRAEDVRLPAQLSTTTTDPTFELIGADRLPDGHLRMRLRCRTAGECLPFHVTVIATHDRPVLLAAATPSLPGMPSTASSPLRTTQAPQTAAIQALPAEQLTLNPGTKLTLLLDEGHMHIHLPVITLNRAAGGEVIRVATMDHKRMYRATLLDEKTARGVIE